MIEGASFRDNRETKGKMGVPDARQPVIVKLLPHKEASGLSITSSGKKEEPISSDRALVGLKGTKGGDRPSDWRKMHLRTVCGRKESITGMNASLSGKGSTSDSKR